MQFKMNDLTLIQSSAGVESRVSLLDYVEPGVVDGIEGACRVPKEIQSMFIMVPGSDRVSNFKLGEFCNPEGLVKIHPSTVVAAQATRDGLNDKYGGRIGVFITCGFRTQADQRRLAVDQGLGWADQGGKVARNSMHLHGCAIDFHAFDWKTGRRVDKGAVKAIAEVFFDYTKKYPDTGHIHGDTRYAAGILKK